MERLIDVAPRRLKKKDLAMVEYFAHPLEILSWLPKLPQRYNCPSLSDYQFSNKWFKPEEASSLRKKVRKLLLDEFRNATRQNCVSDQDPLSSVGPQEERLQTIDC